MRRGEEIFDLKSWTFAFSSYIGVGGGEERGNTGKEE
jgi:hypothetical protein